MFKKTHYWNNYSKMNRQYVLNKNLLERDYAYILCLLVILQWHTWPCLKREMIIFFLEHRHTIALLNAKQLKDALNHIWVRKDMLMEATVYFEKAFLRSI